MNKTLCLFTAFLVLSLPASPLRAQAPASTASWNFDEGTGTVAEDSPGGGHIGMLQGDAGWTAGLLGPHALSLPGKAGSDVDVPHAVLDTTQSYTVAAWVKVNDVAGYQTFVSQDGERVSGFFLQLRGDTGVFALTALNADREGEGEGVVAAATDETEAGIWYHLAGVHDAQARTLALYVDGKLQQTVPYSSAWRAGGHLEIGRGKYAGNPVDWVGGSLDDVRVYQAALSASDIRALAAPGLAVKARLAPPVDAPALATVRIDAARVTAHVSPVLYGLMTEEISHSYDGGLYGELIQNRALKDDAKAPAHWSLVQDGGASGTVTLDTTQPVPGTALTASLRLDITSPGTGRGAGVANDGYWGIPVTPLTTFRASFYAKASPGFRGPLAVILESQDGTTVYASAKVPRITTDWQPYAVTLRTGNVPPSQTNRFAITAAGAGSVWLTQVSLFPPTYKNRPNGNRIDLMQKLEALKPAFLRLPGGNYLEGNTIAERFDWKKTLGPLPQRPGHQGPWGYRSSDGMGLREFLGWCEDLHMQPVLAVFAGYALGGEHAEPGPALQPFVQDALDEIEYVTGGPDTPWGARRAQDGHPAPFPLTYVEVGNEDFFDKSGSYDGRYAQFCDAIKAKYPRLQLIATTGVKTRTPDLIDEHYYLSPREFERRTHQYDTYSRIGPKIFVGEWAAQEGQPTPDLNAALGDAAWLTGMERNSDVVTMEAYAPLFVNVNSGARQWGTNLIGYDALHSYGSPSYYAQAMFAQQHGDLVLAATQAGGPRLFQDVTRDSRSGTIFLKVVNAAGTSQMVHFTLDGVRSVAPEGSATVLTGDGPRDTNSIDNPRKVVPVSVKVRGVSRDFTLPFPAYSVSVVQLKAK